MLPLLSARQPPAADPSFAWPTLLWFDFVDGRGDVIVSLFNAVLLRCACLQSACLRDLLQSCWFLADRYLNSFPAIFFLTSHPSPPPPSSAPLLLLVSSLFAIIIIPTIRCDACACACACACVRALQALERASTGSLMLWSIFNLIACPFGWPCGWMGLFYALRAKNDGMWYTRCSP